VVKVGDGPFNGFHGTIEEINEEKRKLKVMVKIFVGRPRLNWASSKLRKRRENEESIQF
jgi:transcriptional antiterminator NusG